MQCRRADTHPIAARSDIVPSSSLEDSSSEDSSLEDNSSEDDCSSNEPDSPSPQPQHKNFEVARASPRYIPRKHSMQHINKNVFDTNENKSSYAKQLRR